MRMILAVLIIWASIADAAAKDRPLPPGCIRLETAYTQGGQVQLGLPSKGQHLYLIENRLPYPLYLTDELQAAETYETQARELSPGKWSALALTHDPVMLNCIEQRPSGMQYIACEQALTVCQIAKVTLTQPGDYWLAENVSLAEMMQILNYSRE